MIKVNPPSQPLPPDVISLMHRIIELVNLPAKGSQGGQVFGDRLADMRQNQRRPAGSMSSGSRSNSAEKDIGGSKGD